MPAKQVMLGLAAMVAVLFAAGCGGKSNGGSVAPTLIGTEIATVSPVPPTAVVCTPPEQLTLPANFPDDIPTPPDRVVFSVKTNPYLQVVLRVSPPVDPNRNEPAHGVAADAVVQRLTTLGWKPTLNERVTGLDYTMTNPDGRILHFNSFLKRECPGAVQLTYDLEWIKP